jgi:aspartate racemase
MTARKTVGVLGGMGPAATAEFFRRLVAATPARADAEHLHVIIDDDPSVPDRTNAILRGGPSPAEALAAIARRLERAGADLLVMPCNTAHVYIEEIRGSVSIPALDMIRETVATIDRSSVGLLATDGTIATGLYQEACEARGVRVVVPDSADQRSIMDAIAGVKRGESPRRVEEEIEPIVCRLEREGAEAVLVGCTEISLVRGDGMSVPWIDALDCLVEATLRDAWPGVRLGDGKEAE